MPTKKEKEVKEKIILPPQNIEAEQCVLGSILLDKEAILKVGDILSPSHFYREDHGRIYKAMLDLLNKRTPIDVVTLTDALEKEKILSEVGGASYITSLVNAVPTAAHIVDYAKIIIEKSTRQRLISAGTKIVEIAYDEERPTPEVLDEAEKSLFTVSQTSLRDNFVSLKDILSESFDRLDKVHNNKDDLRGVPSGYKDLDSLLGGFQSSDLIILAARPSMGKTSFAMAIAHHAAVDDKIPVGFFSLEMSKEQLADRLICAEAGIDSWKLRTGNLSDEDFPKVGQAMGVLSEAPLFVDETASIGVMEVRTKARRLQMEHGLGLIVIDYLQLMRGTSKSSDYNRVQEISEISRSLKSLAKELNVPIIALSQLSRAVEHRDKKIPQLADLRESGSIEQDADVVMFIYREDYYEPESEKKNIAEIHIKKHRNGPTGQIDLYFIPEQMSFRSIERRRKNADE